MGRLGDHPNIVTVFDIGEEQTASLIWSRQSWPAATSKA